MRTIPAVIATLCLAAHFTRWGNFFAVLLVLGLGLAAAVKRRGLAVTLLKYLLYGSPAAWLVQAREIAVERAALGEPYLRAVFILTAVAAFSVWAAYIIPVEKPEPPRT